ncbi:DUF5344 family protein [Bacillus haynesii]|uniref:DUF5344 family protein n=1 Tax=Bacillus haynesii TaxID=1925021 RepID=UPI00398FF2C8
MKVNTGEAKQALSKLKHSSHSMNASVPTDIKGLNHLDTTKKIEELNQTINMIASSYASAFSKQVAQTESAVDAMMDTDKQLASSTMIEIPNSWHRKYYKVIHGLKGKGESFRNDPELKAQYNYSRGRYWKWRAEEIEKQMR